MLKYLQIQDIMHLLMKVYTFKGQLWQNPKNRKNKQVNKQKTLQSDQRFPTKYL